MREVSSRTVGVVAYITWIGWIIAFLIRDRRDAFAAHHLNQALMINLMKIAGGLCVMIPKVGEGLSSAIGLAAFILIIMGIYRAVNWRTDPLPLVGGFQVL